MNEKYLHFLNNYLLTLFFTTVIPYVGLVHCILPNGLDFSDIRHFGCNFPRLKLFSCMVETLDVDIARLIFFNFATYH